MLRSAKHDIHHVVNVTLLAFKKYEQDNFYGSIHFVYFDLISNFYFMLMKAMYNFGASTLHVNHKGNDHLCHRVA